MTEFYSNGKLLLTGEYAVLDGATALALPTSFGQSLKVEAREKPGIHWKSFDYQNQIWFEGEFQREGDEIRKSPTSKNGISEDHKNVAERLENILTEAIRLNPSFFRANTGFSVTTHLNFPQNWGLGTSSTLINNIASWTGVDAYLLLEKTFGGSGYDIASAQNNHPVTYSLSGNNRSVLATGFDPEFKEELFFVHLNRKQNSRSSIAQYRTQHGRKPEDAIDKISALTHQVINASTISEFELFLEIHETVISQLINTPKIKSRLFSDYPRTIKSLGGWGGDFILATGNEENKDYFRNKGYSTIVPYEKMIL